MGHGDHPSVFVFILSKIGNLFTVWEYLVGLLVDFSRFLVSFINFLVSFYCFLVPFCIFLVDFHTFLVDWKFTGDFTHVTGELQ
jgi:hypothetical protein